MAIKAPLRVLIVEDSLTARELLVSIVQSDPTFQVVGVARNGLEGTRLAQRLKPDVITMDIHMPEMDGFEATRQIMAENPRPIVMISASFNKNERYLTFNALKSGALTVLEKPSLNDPPEAHLYMLNQLRLMAEVKVVRRWADTAQASPLPQPLTLKRNGRTKIQLVAIAASTGGPGALAEILGKLPANFPAPILIAQHITVGFSEGLAAWLNQQTSLTVQLAQHASEMQPGQVLLAPDNYHLEVSSLGLVSLNQAPPRFGLRPSADYLFESVARVYGSTAIGIILTGMGSDGAEGLQTLRRSGAHTIAQNESSCVVFGMPAVAIKLGAVEQILPVNQIAAAVQLLV